MHRNQPAESVDDHGIVFVIAPANRGWILEGICTEIASRTTRPTAFHYGLRPLPPASTYFFSHHSLFAACRNDPALRRSTTLTFYTHPAFPAKDAGRVARSLRSCSKVISMSTLHARGLIAAGLPTDAIEVIVPGADPDVFRSHRRGRGPVGFCSAYYPRKGADVVLDLVRALPDQEFRLLGRHWPEAPVFPLLQECRNFTYVQAEYESYSEFYNGIDVFVSPSRLEGGPIPLIEAMMANVIPVATRTGFAADIISDGVNGFLCDVDAPVADFAERIRAAADLDVDVRATVRHLTWDAFATRILALAG